MTLVFHEHVYIPKSEDFTASSCTVKTDTTGEFVIVETDPFEGSAMFTLPVAERVHEILGRAIIAAKDYRAAAK